MTDLVWFGNFLVPRWEAILLLTVAGFLVMRGSSLALYAVCCAIKWTWRALFRRML